MADRYIQRFVKQFPVKYDQYIGDTAVDVLVLGPTVRNANLDRAAHLRKEILRRCRDYGASVQGEHAQLIREAKAKSGAGHNLCSYEIELARQVDLIVLVPASAGSIAELGLLALLDDAGPKTVVLFRRDFRRARSYIMEGPRKAFRFRGATMRYVDYASVEQSWKIVQTAIEQKKALKVDRKRFGKSD